MLDWLKKQWNMISATATWVGEMVRGFWRPPEAAINTVGVPQFGQYVLTIAVGLLLIPAHLFREKKHTLWWVALAVAFLLGSLPVFFSYQHYATAWTCPYAGTRVVVGGEEDLTPHGADFFDKNSDLTTREVVWIHAGDVGELWNQAAIESRRERLQWMYIGYLPLFAAALICGIQAFYCGTRSR